MLPREGGVIEETGTSSAGFKPGHRSGLQKKFFRTCSSWRAGERCRICDKDLLLGIPQPHNLRKKGSGHRRYEYPSARISATAARSDMLSAATNLMAQTFFVGWLAPARTHDVFDAKR